MYKNPFKIEFELNLESNAVNAAGLMNLVRLIPVNLVKVIPKPVMGVVALRDFVWVDQSKIYDILIADNSGVFSETMTDDVNGKYWLQEVGFDLPKNRIGLANFLKKMIWVEWLAIVTTRNQDTYLLGNLKQAISITEETATTDVRGGQNKRQWKLSGNVTDLPFRLDAS